jgi:hypothetical protein
MGVFSAININIFKQNKGCVAPVSNSIALFFPSYPGLNLLHATGMTLECVIQAQNAMSSS